MEQQIYDKTTVNIPVYFSYIFHFGFCSNDCASSIDIFIVIEGEIQYDGLFYSVENIML